MRESTHYATFKGWKLPNGQSINSTFTILIKLKAGRGVKLRYHALLDPTMQELEHPGGLDGYAESGLDECKADVAKQFEEQITDWQSDTPDPLKNFNERR